MRRREGWSHINTPLHHGAHDRLRDYAAVVAFCNNLRYYISPMDIVGPSILRTSEPPIAHGALEEFADHFVCPLLPISISGHVASRSRLLPPTAADILLLAAETLATFPNWLRTWAFLATPPWRFSLRKGAGGLAFASPSFVAVESGCVWTFFPSLECPGGDPSCQMNGGKFTQCVICGGLRSSETRAALVFLQWRGRPPTTFQHIPKG